MKLCIHIVSDKHLEAVAGITKAAVSKGHEVAIFTMVDGTRLLEKPVFTDLCRMSNVKMSFCDHNAIGMGINKELIPPEIVCGSQYDNAVMVGNADRVIVL